MVDEEGLPKVCFVPESSDEIGGNKQSNYPKFNPLYAGNEDGLNLQRLMTDANCFDEMAEALSTIRTP